MYRDICLATLLCMALTLIGRAAPPAEADRETAEAEALRLADAYQARAGDLAGALKTNDLATARVAAEALLALSDAPASPDFRGRRPWKARIPTLYDLINKFQQKKVLGAADTRRYSEQLLARLEGRERELLAIRHASFQYTYALGDDAAHLAAIDAGLASPALKPADQVKACIERARLRDDLDFDDYVAKALVFAGEDADLRATVYRACFNTERTRGAEAVLKDLRAAMRDPVLKPRLLASGRGLSAGFARQIVAQLNRMRRYDEALDFLTAAITHAPTPPEQSLAYEQMAGIHLLKARRYYATESPVALKTAYGCITRSIDLLPSDDPAGLMKRLLMRMDVANRMNARARVEADAALLETRLPERREHWFSDASYARGIAAYRAEAYADARARFEAIPLEQERKRRKLYILDYLIRCCCATGDYEAALAYRPSFEETNRNWGDMVYTLRGEGFDQDRYNAYFKSLEQQAARVKAAK
jgi:hypothetical protein